nr:MAG TPA: hypothetical protein [Caudoviricetes sp.]
MAHRLPLNCRCEQSHFKIKEILHEKPLQSDRMRSVHLQQLLPCAD